MRPPPSYAPPDAPIRKRIPVAMPDDFGTREAADRRVAAWLAAALFALFIVALVLLGGKP